MPAPQRPAFYEGQILAARDLTAAVDHGRGQLARHARYLHSWGIGQGLDLVESRKQDAGGTSYVEVTVATGYAVDGTGREIVVAEPVLLSEARFAQTNTQTRPEVLYPVFLQGMDQSDRQQAGSVGACDSNGQANRINETPDVVFGREGDERKATQQVGPEVAAGPDGLPAGWLILLGFVKWDSANERFTGTAKESHGIRRRYAGVTADTVAARSGRLVLQTHVEAEAGKPAVMIDEESGELRFGALDASAIVSDPVLKVTAKGDIEAKGTLSATQKTGTVQVQSGIATDGVVLPLPPGVTQEQVDNDQVTLHVYVTPRIPGASLPAGAGPWHQLVGECRVDDARRVRCRITWFDLTGASGPEDRVAACDYLVIASVPPATGGTP